jgi:Raf kinase inhibitor-like YbhB/YbcL family protein
LGRCDRSAVSRVVRTAAALSVLVLADGCGLLGGPGALRQDTPQVITVSSPVFNLGVIPRRYSCHGAESPPIFWSGAPQGTKSIALVVDDSDAPVAPFVYWIVFDISPAATDIQAGRLPPGARQADNSRGQATFDPPCPANGSHMYRFTVYALDTVLNERDGAGLELMLRAIARHAIARGRLTGTVNPPSSDRGGASARPDTAG